MPGFGLGGSTPSPFSRLIVRGRHSLRRYKQDSLSFPMWRRHRLFPQNYPFSSPLLGKETYNFFRDSDRSPILLCRYRQASTPRDRLVTFFLCSFCPLDQESDENTVPFDESPLFCRYLRSSLQKQFFFPQTIRSNSFWVPALRSHEVVAVESFFPPIRMPALYLSPPLERRRNFLLPSSA